MSLSYAMPRNIYIVGAQCTGKTTLVNALEDHFASSPSSPLNRPGIIREVARSVLKTHKFTAEDIRSSPSRAFELQRLILEAQLLAERKALETSEWFISDRSGVDPICYALQYVGKDEASKLLQSENWQELKPRLADGVIIVCESGADWLTDDGVRLMPLDKEEWVAFHVLFCEFLNTLGLAYTVLPARLMDIWERVSFVLAAIKTAEDELKRSGLP